MYLRNSNFNSMVLRLYVSILLLLTNTIEVSCAAEQPTQPSTLAVTAENPNIAQVSKQLLLKSVELNRFVLRYRLEADKQPKSRIWRYPLTQEVASSGHATYDIVAINQYGSHMNDPDLINKNALRGGQNASLVGSTVAGGGSALELSATFMRALMNKKQGYDPIGSEQHFLSCLKEIDGLIAQRDRIASTFEDENTRQILLLEGKILHELRNYQVAEFLAFHEDMTGYLSYEGTYYFLDVATRTLEACSSIYSLKALHNEKYAGTSSILFTIGGVAVMASPLVASAVGYMVKKHNRQRFLHKFNEQITTNSAALQDDLHHLQTLRDLAATQSSASIGRLSERLSLYTTEGKSFQSALEQETKQARIRSKVAIQSNIFGPLIGSTTVTQGILKMTAYFDYKHLPTTPDKLVIADKLYYAGSIVGLVGSAASFSITASLLASSLHYRQQLAREKRLPRHLLEQRLAYLDEMEKEINAMP